MALPLRYRLLLGYLQYLQEQPLLTKCVTSAVLNGSEESLTYENGINFRWFKTFKMAAYGFFVGAPLGHFAYDLLNRLVPGTSPLQRVLQLLISNGVILPVQTYVYIVAMGLIDGRSMLEAQKLVKSTFVPIMTTSLKYFPVIQLVIFRYVPQLLWVPVFNLIGLLFGIYVNATAKRTSEARK